MTRILTTFAAALAVLFAVSVTRAEDRVDPPLNEPAPQFSLTDVATGNSVSLSDYKGKVVVITFQSILCPWNKMKENAGYERYLVPLSQKYADKNVQFLAINSNKNESVEDISAYHGEHNIPYPILKDPGNVIADAYNAQTTPHIYVIAPDDQQTLVYMGGIEQVPTSPEKCGEMSEQYLEPVIKAVLAGEQLPYTKTVSKGCSIKRKNK